jgi:hypothetical protein
MFQKSKKTPRKIGLSFHGSEAKMLQKLNKTLRKVIIEVKPKYLKNKPRPQEKQGLSWKRSQNILKINKTLRKAGAKLS